MFTNGYCDCNHYSGQHSDTGCAVASCACLATLAVEVAR